MIYEDRAEESRLRFLRENQALLNPAIVEALSKPDVEEDSPIVLELLAQIRRLADAMEKKSAPPNINVLPAPLTVSPPVVNVSPIVSAPAVNVSPNVMLDAPLRWHVDVQHHLNGPMAGKIKSVEFIAVSPCITYGH